MKLLNWEHDESYDRKLRKRITWIQFEWYSHPKYSQKRFQCWVRGHGINGWYCHDDGIPRSENDGYETFYPIREEEPLYAVLESGRNALLDGRPNFDDSLEYRGKKKK